MRGVFTTSHFSTQITQLRSKTMESQVKEHYNSDNLTENINIALIKAGKDIANLDPKDISIIDQLHVGGALASIKLLKKAGLDADAFVLDAGCGIGGSSRLITQLFSCRVTGVDLAQKFIEAANFLTKCTGLDSKTKFKQGSVLELEFADNLFDAVLCQHVLMNIEDKTAAIKEFFRVLKPGGKLILHEVTKGSDVEIEFPVPWASESSISFVQPWDTLSGILKTQGFKTLMYADESDAALSWQEKAKNAVKKRVFNTQDLGPGLVFGNIAQFFPKNMYNNLKNNAVCLIESVQEKSYVT